MNRRPEGNKEGGTEGVNEWVYVCAGEHVCNYVSIELHVNVCMFDVCVSTCM